MTEMWARRFSIYLARAGYIEPEKRELLEYGIFHIFSTALHLLLLLAAGLLMRNLLGIVAYTVGFCVLKRDIGGAHASTHWGCLWGYTLAAAAGATLGRLLHGLGAPSYVPPFLCGVALLLIVWRAPALHPYAPNHRGEKIRRFKRRAVLIATALIAVVSLCAVLQIIPELAFCVSLGSLSAALTLLLPIPYSDGEGGGTNDIGT